MSNNHQPQFELSSGQRLRAFFMQKKEVKKTVKAFYTVKEIMGLMGISRALAYKSLGSEIPMIRVGRKILVPGWFVRKLTEEPK